MSQNKGKILTTSLSELIAKFSQHDVIAEMEKEYQSAPARLIPISLIDDVYILSSVEIPEKTIDYFAEGLREKGFYNPLVVRERNNRFEIILGRKRFFGAKRAGILSLPCAVLDIEDEEDLLMLLADARDQRDNNVLEMALICNELQTKFNYPQKMLAEISHQSRSQITNILRILKLPKSLRRELASGNLTYGHAKVLAGVDPERMDEIWKYAKAKNLSVHQFEDYVRGLHFPNIENEDESKYKVHDRVSVFDDHVEVSFSSEEEKKAILKLLEKL